MINWPGMQNARRALYIAEMTAFKIISSGTYAEKKALNTKRTTGHLSSKPISFVVSFDTSIVKVFLDTPYQGNNLVALRKSDFSATGAR